MLYGELDVRSPVLARWLDSRIGRRAALVSRQVKNDHIPISLAPLGFVSTTHDGVGGGAAMRVLRLNAKGDDVKAWQTFLRGVEHYDGALDAHFGQKTEAATRAFQEKHGLLADGIAGNGTLGKAMLLGFAVAVEDTPLPGGLKDGISSMNDAWQAPLPQEADHWLVTVDPRVITDHQPGVLPCPSNPPPPVGWTYTKGGEVTSALGDFAQKVLGDRKAYPMGAFVQARIDGQTVAARVEWHNFQGKSGRHGCFIGVNLFRPKAIA
jgi:peptidoglycan hydrolase-like protein with peptidoglycan-binding domain